MKSNFEWTKLHALAMHGLRSKLQYVVVQRDPFEEECLMLAVEDRIEAMDLARWFSSRTSKFRVACCRCCGGAWHIVPL